MVRVFLIVMVGLHAFFLWSVRGRVQKGDPDFTVYFTAAKILREGKAAELYNAATQASVQWEFANDRDIRRSPLPYIHPPFEALLFLPLTFFSYGQAFALWNLLNVGVLVATVLLLRSPLKALRQVPLWESMLALLAFFPVFVNFLQGQDAILLLLIFVLGYRALDRDAEFIAGCWFGLGVFKYHFAIPLLLILAVWKGRRVVAGFASTACAAVVLSLWIVGWHGALLYPGYAWHIVSVPGYGQTPLALMPNLLGLVTGWPLLENAGWPMRALALAGCAGLLTVVARMRDLARLRDSDGRFFSLALACAVITAVVVSYLTNAHDLCLLVLPLAVLADHCAARWSEQKAIRGLLLPVVPLLISPLWIFLWMHWGRLNLIAILLLWWIYAMRRELMRPRKGEPQTAAPLSSSV